MVTAGGIEAQHLISMIMIDQDDEVIMMDPGYRHCYEPNVHLADGRMIYAKTREERQFLPDPFEISKKITKKTKMLILINPDNPTGAVIVREDLGKLSDLAKENNLFVIFDEVLNEH